MDTQYLKSADLDRDPVDRYLDSVELLDGKLNRIIAGQRELVADFQRIAMSLRALAQVR